MAAGDGGDVWSLAALAEDTELCGILAAKRAKIAPTSSPSTPEVYITTSTPPPGGERPSLPKFACEYPSVLAEEEEDGSDVEMFPAHRNARRAAPNHMDASTAPTAAAASAEAASAWSAASLGRPTAVSAHIGATAAAAAASNRRRRAASALQLYHGGAASARASFSTTHTAGRRLLSVSTVPRVYVESASPDVNAGNFAAMAISPAALPQRSLSTITLDGSPVPEDTLGQDVQWQRELWANESLARSPANRLQSLWRSQSPLTGSADTPPTLTPSIVRPGPVTSSAAVGVAVVVPSAVRPQPQSAVLRPQASPACATPR